MSASKIEWTEVMWKSLEKRTARAERDPCQGL